MCGYEWVNFMSHLVDGDEGACEDEAGNDMEVEKSLCTA